MVPIYQPNEYLSNHLQCHHQKAFRLQEHARIHKPLSSLFQKTRQHFIRTSFYTRKSSEIYFQATMLMNIGVEYLALVSSIQKDWKDENTNLAEVILHIIRHFEFIEGNKKVKIMQTSTPLIYRTPKRSYINKKCVKKGLTTHYID